MSDKIRISHLERKAVVYLRQSSLRQVRENRESTTRQYALRDRARALGWSADQIETIDEDLGQSGSSAQWRSGFQRLAEQVAHGEVGALFALEVSRLARSSADWHRLLELAGLADVLICDEDVIYDPKDYNDRLLLGLKGQFADAELYWMRLRLEGGRLSKARRGELVFGAPTGYVWDHDGKLCKDPDEEVRKIVALVFERFDIESSARKVLRYFHEHGLQMPLRDKATGELRWTPPRHHWLLFVLRNPTYAGAYVFGRHEQRKALVDGKVQQHHRRLLPVEKWKVCLRDHHPAYVSWEKYLENLEKLRGNSFRTLRGSMDKRGAAREGQALLQGIALCGRCGRRMYTQYNRCGDSIRPGYYCRGPKGPSLEQCWSVAGTAIDEAVASQVVRVLQPAEVDLSLAIARDADRQSAQIDRQWSLRLDRARYEARIAERRYKAVDPEHRTVARTLEKEWNDKLEALSSAEREYETARQRELVEMSDSERTRMMRLARDVEQIWSANTTTAEDRKAIVRSLVQAATLSPVDIPERMTKLQILWVTGATTELHVPSHEVSTRIQPQIKELLVRLAAGGATDVEIAEELNRRGLDYPPARKQPRTWNTFRVRQARARLGLGRKHGPRTDGHPQARRADGMYSSYGITQLLEIPITTVDEWVQQGHLVPTVRGRQTHSWYRLSKADIERLCTLRDDRRARDYDRSNHPGRVREEK